MDSNTRPAVSEELVRDAVRRIGDNLGIAIEDTQKRRVASEAILRDFAAAVRADALYAECPEVCDCGTVYRRNEETTELQGFDCPNPLCRGGKVSIVEQARAEIKETVADYEEQISGLIREHEATVRAARAEGRAEAFREAAGMIYAKPMSQHGYSEMLRTKAEEKP